MRDKLTICYETTDNSAILLVARETNDRNIIVSKFENDCARDLYEILLNEIKK